MNLSRAFRIWLAVPPSVLICCVIAFSVVPAKTTGGLVIGCICLIAALASGVVAPAAAFTVFEERRLRNWPNACRIFVGAVPVLLLAVLIAVGLSNADSAAFKLGG